MASVLIRVLFPLCLASCFSCRSAAPLQRDVAYASFAPAESDVLRFGFDWRMGLVDSLRAGSALFFRFELPPDKTGEIKALHVVDRFASHIGADYTLSLIEGREKTIGVLAFSPEETATLPAGLYEVAVEIQFVDGSLLLSKLLPFHLLPQNQALGGVAANEEQCRFAALLQLNNDKKMYIEPVYGDNILARLLHFYDASVQRPMTGEREVGTAEQLAEWTREGDLTVRERELSILALDEIYTRLHGVVKNGK